MLKVFLAKLEEHREANRERGNIEQSNLSDYILSFDSEDNKKLENKFIQQHKLSLFRIYDNRCAKCGTDEDDLMISTFVYRRTSGGCFTMKHKNGDWISNAIPLCKPCNILKANKELKAFFPNKEKLQQLFKKNKEMTKRLNAYQE